MKKNILITMFAGVMLAGFGVDAQAQIYQYDLGAGQATDYWQNFNRANVEAQTGETFPNEGGVAWPVPIGSQKGNGSATFAKTNTGGSYLGGGDGRYIYGGHADGPSSYEIAIGAPIGGVQTVIFQLYSTDFFGMVYSGGAPMLSYTTSEANSGSMGAEFTEQYSWYAGTFDAPPPFGPTPYDHNLFAYQYDLSGISLGVGETITELNINFALSNFIETSKMQVDQSALSFAGNSQLVPEPATGSLILLAGASALLMRRRKA